MKNFKSLTIVLTVFSAIFTGTWAQAETLHAPKVCDHAKMLIKNLSAVQQPLWFQFLGEKGFEESRWTLEKFESKELLEADLPAGAFSVKTDSAHVLVLSECGQQLFPWSPRVSSYRHWSLNEGSAYKGFVQNLNPKPQTLMLRFLSADRRILEARRIELGPYMTTSDFKFWSQGVEVEIESEGRISMALLENQNGVSQIRPELTNVPVKVAVDPTAAYFMLSTDDQRDSFIVKIDDPVMLAKARNILSKGIIQLMVAEIGYAPGSENRSLISPDPTPFSWHVNKVNNFNDFASIDCDGSPSNVEEKIFDWLASKKICFWNYHLVKELSSREVQYGITSSNP